MAINVKSVWMALHHALPHLRARGGGSVINISSVQALATGANNSAYAAGKGALVAGTRGLAVELAPDRIRVNCISPGRIWTDEPGDWLRRQLGPELHREFHGALRGLAGLRPDADTAAPCRGQTRGHRLLRRLPGL